MGKTMKQEGVFYLIKIIILLLILLLPFYNFADETAANSLNDIIVQKSANELRVYLNYDGDVHYKNFELSDPNRTVIDLFGVIKSTSKSVYKVGEFGVERIRVGQFTLNTARVVFDITEKYPYRLEKIDKGMKITFYKDVKVTPSTEQPAEKTIEKLKEKVQPDEKVSKEEKLPAQSSAEPEAILPSEEAKESHWYFGKMQMTGLISYQENYVTANGNKQNLQGGISRFYLGYSDEERANLSLSGNLLEKEGKEPYVITGNIWYDSRDWTRDVSTEGEFRQEPTGYVRVDRYNSYLAVGDYIDTFEDLELARPSLSMRGFNAHIEIPHTSRMFQASFFGARMRTGIPEVYMIRGNGTKGYFYLPRIPVKIGSEMIRVEVRDRYEPTRVLRSFIKIRGIDYYMDYNIGRFLFNKEIVRDEDFEGNPIYIVVQYEPVAEEEVKPYVGGARGVFRPTEWLQIGASYTGQFPGEALSVNNPTNRVTGFDTKFSLGDALIFTGEYVQSNNSDTNSTAKRDERAWKADLRYQPIERVRFDGIYRRIADDFTPIGFIRNTALIRGKEEYEARGNWQFTKYHTFRLGYRRFHDNVLGLPERRTNWGDGIFTEIEQRISAFSLLRVGYELRNDWDGPFPRERNYRNQIPYIALDQALGKLFSVEARYEARDRDDLLNTEHDTITHIAGLNFKFKPKENLLFYVWPKYAIERDKEAGEYIRRKIGGEVGVNGKWFKGLSTLIAANHEEAEDLLTNQLEIKTDSLSFTLDFTPWENIESAWRYEFIKNRFILENRIWETVNGDATIIFHLTKNLTMRPYYEIRINKTDAPEPSQEFSWQRATLEANYLIGERFSSFAKYGIKWSTSITGDFPAAKTTAEFYLAGLTWLFTKRWDIGGQYKKIVMRGALRNQRDSLIGELGFRFFKFMKIVGGYEWVFYFEGMEPPPEPPYYGPNDYDASKFYMRLVGKF